MIVAGDAGVSVLGCIGMSHIPSPHFRAERSLSNGNGSRRPGDQAPPSERSEDSAIDSALRAVPLPDGLITRLGLLVYTMPEDAPDQVDWLGC
jgi:hypothetical protein